MLPEDTGWTANEVADRLLPQGTVRTRFDVIRRRVQELQNPMRLLTVIGEREGMTGADAQVYALHPNGLWREAIAKWEAGEAWPFYGILARASDPDTSQKAWHNLRPETDRHKIIRFFVRRSAE
jgi:hypothetical protein